MIRSPAQRRVVWFSCGAASAVAAKVTLEKDPAATIVYCAIVTFIILKVVGAVMGLRVGEEAEIGGLDYSLHGETVQ